MQWIIEICYFNVNIFKLKVSLERFDIISLFRLIEYDHGVIFISIHH